MNEASGRDPSRVAELRRAAMAKRRLRKNIARITGPLEDMNSAELGRGIGMTVIATSVATSAARGTRRVVREAPLIAIGTAIAAGVLIGSRRRRQPPATGHQTAFSAPNPVWTGLASLGIQLFLDALASRRFDTMEHGG